MNTRYLPYILLNVYNLNGQLVKTLVNGYKKSGKYIIEWNGQDENGNCITSGVYLLNMKTDSYVSWKKMILLR